MAGLYLHIPFCSQRCIYCDFYFVTTERSHAGFVRSVIAELEYYAQLHASDEPIHTIYFGGGTPSLLTEYEIEQILASMYRSFDVSDVREITFELNPEDVSLDYLQGLRAMGIDRLSVGIQSFFSADLGFLSRSHSEEEAREIVPMVRKAGFDNFSVDLIFGIPDQPTEYWAANLERAIQLEVPHLSTYGLTVEERTVLHNRVQRGLVMPPGDDVLTERYRFTMDYLREHGYEHYEISNFARPGFRSQHNQTYWDHRNYLGFGPSAHSFWRKRLPRPSAFRWSNVRNLRRYEALLDQGQLPLESRELLSADEMADEYLMLRLRTSDGLDLQLFEDQYGVDLLYEKLDDLAWLESEGYIEPIRNHKVRLTDLGKTVCDSVTQRLLLEEREDDL